MFYYLMYYEYLVEPVVAAKNKKIKIKIKSSNFSLETYQNKFEIIS